MTYDVFVVGSINTDLTIRVDRRPAPGETVAGSDLVVSAGGKGGNQAAAAGRLGGRVALLARVGDDERGAMLGAALRAMGVDDAYLQTTRERATGSALITLTPDGENTIVVSGGANAALGVADVEAIASDLRAARVVLAQLEVPLATVARALAIAADAGRRAILNASPAVPLAAEMLARLDPLVVNEHEAELYLREPVTSASAAAAAEALVARGLRSVVITLGAAGAVYASETGDAGAAAAPPTDVVDTTGAGDAFAGALALELARDRPLGDAVAFAVRAGAYAVRAPGAQASLPTRDNLSA